jgi:hypothetical protein
VWKEQFDFLYEENESFIFPISIHPQVCGKSQVILMHRRLLVNTNAHEGVEWCTFSEVVKEFKEGKMLSVNVEGGAI